MRLKNGSQLTMEKSKLPRLWRAKATWYNPILMGGIRLPSRKVKYLAAVHPENRSFIQGLGAIGPGC